jgi:hypothetical protein
MKRRLADLWWLSDGRLRIGSWLWRLTPKKLRWEIVNRRNTPGQCWANLVSAALYLDDYGPRQPMDASCRSDSAANGSCYCGKLRHGWGL